MIYDPNENRGYKKRQWQWTIQWLSVVVGLAMILAAIILTVIGTSK